MGYLHNLIVKYSLQPTLFGNNFVYTMLDMNILCIYIVYVRLTVPIAYHFLFLVSGNLAGRWIIIESLGCMDNGHYKFSSLLKIQFSSPEN